jgi:hypothetical protein
VRCNSRAAHAQQPRPTLTEHVLSADFAPRIAASGVHAPTSGLGGAAARSGAPVQEAALETLKKRHFRDSTCGKNRLPKSTHVLFSAPILIARVYSHRVSQR